MVHTPESGRTFTPVIPHGCDATYWLCSPSCNGRFAGRKETIAFRGERPVDEIGLVVQCTDAHCPQGRRLCARLTTWIDEEFSGS